MVLGEVMGGLMYGDGRRGDGGHGWCDDEADAARGSFMITINFV